MTIQLYKGANKFDWDDLTFKSSGWVTPDLDVPFVRGCTYHVGESFNGAGDTIDMTDGDILTTDGTVVIGGNTYPLEPRVYRCIQSVHAAAAHSNRNEIVRAGGASLLRVYEIDGTTVLSEAPVTDYAGTALTTTGVVNVPEKRGAPA